MVLFWFDYSIFLRSPEHWQKCSSKSWQMCLFSVLYKCRRLFEYKFSHLDSRPVTTDIQFSSCVICHYSAFFSYLHHKLKSDGSFIEKGFLTATRPRRPFLMTLLWTDGSTERWDVYFRCLNFFLCHFVSLKVRFQRLHFLVRQHLVSSETWVGTSNSPLTHCSSGSEDDTTHKHTGGHTKQSHQFYTCSCTSCTDSKF